VVEHEAAGPADRAGRSLIGQVEIGAEAAVQIVGADAVGAEEAPGRRRVCDAG